MGAEYDAAARSSDIYGVSLAETEYEYFVVMRMPKSADDVKNNYDRIMGYYHEKIYFDYKNEIIGRAVFEPNKFYEEIDLINIVD